MKRARNAVYILANARPTLYVGVTSNLARRLAEHRGHVDTKSFTAQFKVHRLVYVEYHDSIVAAIAREKYIKHMTRDEKLALIRATNPTLRDLAPPTRAPRHGPAPPPWEQRKHRW